MKIFFCFSAGLALVTLQNAAASPDVKYPPRCYPDPCAGITFQDDKYICGDPRLGPRSLPSFFPLTTELRTYSRFGDLCPFEFLLKWTTDIRPNGTYIYPPEDGFLLDTQGSSIQGNVTLPIGQKIDRFGSESGTFLAVLGAPYIERALPPTNLDTEDGFFPYNYHVYEVLEPLVVNAGPIASWFEQPGLGTQFDAYDSVIDLIGGGYIRRMRKSEYSQSMDYAADYLPAPDSE
ncbi:uncharacterized protein AKAW2_30008S [Aspergillus luchuensis]|uniref:TNT domain-containing protein n=2 Tax=Aspergillus subgen. Circumdati TaxID=2720871 RepID=A0A3F3PIZ7_9EURO|nr:hypothetical protein BDQ94DRAFT_185711 [Aspergillus welwitschiae]XP_041540455.1 uncharacterized protein AKAW2_30008S [Aspergillus luchuensis]GAA92942.1 hypothetical protein AKAW_11055 [Aspergillus luchuensis IFO 4308]RDH26905.1 hypothetical protein BDQ94DRAFT_185711 [Aspergillus welwitschiae]BCR96689.1 hypothetical protein AKAW2_30008S [Aspergillus luchuensis]BCS09191.1 hypothetical protein ALUC_30008S [Aspergillus luchuensis]GAT21864.1 hypothetical protein RIB2604_01200120 [Aspergillus lu